MLSKFSRYLEDECDFRNEKVLLTVSGGVDSVVLLDLFSKYGGIGLIAHCNFHLRGEESDGDEEFVRELQQKYNYEVVVENFDTLKYAEEEKISIQMAARELRYNWFDQLMKKTNCTSIAVAHNQDDLIETFFINLTRGTGIKGLSGIKARHKNLIRPLLWADRKCIQEYAIANDINWREDSSNAKTKYLRNKIRHQILPLFREIHPGFTQTMAENINKLQKVNVFLNEFINEKKTKFLHYNNNSWELSPEAFVNENDQEFILYEILKEFNFTASAVSDILSSVKSNESGKIFYSENYRLVKDRKLLIIEEKKEPELQRFYIEENFEEILSPLKLSFTLVEISDFELIKDKSIAQLDKDKLNFPLILRKWQKGDYFMPLGMSNLKKVSDFFIDNKLSIPDKEKAWLLTSGKSIVWMIGMRIDDRFKVSEDTEVVYKIKMD